MRRVPLPLGLLLAAALTSSLAWAFLTPPFQGPDEPAHAAYVQLLAETGTKPDPNGGEGAGSTEERAALDRIGFEQTRGNAAARAPSTAADRARWDALERGFTDRDRSNGTGPTLIAGNPPLFYALEVPAYAAGEAAGDLFTALTLMRVVNVLIMLAGVWCTWLLAGEVLRGRVWLQTVATASVALFPKLSSLAATINTDALLFTLVTATAYAAVRIVRRGATARRVLILTALCLAAALTQGRGLAVVPPALLAVGLGLWRFHVPRRAALRLGGLAAGGLAAGAGVVLAVNAAVAQHGSAAFAGEVGRVAGQENGFSAREFLSYVWQFYLPKLGSMTPMLGPPYGFRQVYVETFFGSYASLEVNFSAGMYDVLKAALLIGAAAFVAAVLARGRLFARSWPTAVTLAAFPLTELVLLHLNSYKQLKANPGDPIITGRYLVPFLAFAGLAAAFTLTPLPRRAAAVAGGLLVGVVLALQIGGLGLLLERFYA